MLRVWHCSPLLSTNKFLLLDYSMDQHAIAPTTCYAILPPDEQILYEKWVFRDVASYCEDCFAFSTTITPDMLLHANLHCLLCSPFHNLEGSHTPTWSSIFRRGDQLHHVYTHDIRPFITSIPRLYVIHITNPQRLASWEERLVQKTCSFGNFCCSFRPWWFTETVGNFCHSAGGKSAQACNLRLRILMPLMDKFLCHFWTQNSNAAFWTHLDFKTTYHFIAEVILDFLLGPGPCLRPLPAITKLRSKGYIPETSKLRSARLAILDTDSGTYISEFV